MRYDLIFIVTALICLLVGESLGIWMGINENFLLVPAHVHLNLLGWVTLALFGLMHRAYPALATSRMAAFQCWFAVVANIVMPAGLVVMLLTREPTLVKLGSLAVILATLLFVIMFIRKVALAKAA
jgi:hypothetical protein